MSKEIFEVICIIFSIITVSTLIVMVMTSFQAPDGKIYLKILDNRLWHIDYLIRHSDEESLNISYKGISFSINTKEIKPVENLSYNKTIYKDIYINNELVARLWVIDGTINKHRFIEFSRDRDSYEVLNILKVAYKYSKKKWYEDISKAVAEDTGNKSYFK